MPPIADQDRVPGYDSRFADRGVAFVLGGHVEPLLLAGCRVECVDIAAITRMADEHGVPGDSDSTPIPEAQTDDELFRWLGAKRLLRLESNCENEDKYVDQVISPGKNTPQSSHQSLTNKNFAPHLAAYKPTDRQTN